MKVVRAVGCSVLASVLVWGEATADPSRCRQLAPAFSQISSTVGTLADTLGQISFDYEIQKLPIGSPEREALSNMRDDANAAIVALKALRKSARDAAYQMDVCGEK